MRKRPKMRGVVCVAMLAVALVSLGLASSASAKPVRKTMRAPASGPSGRSRLARLISAFHVGQALTSA